MVSGAHALGPMRQRITYLMKHEGGGITRDGVRIFDRENKGLERHITTSGVTAAAVEKGPYRHYMQKEIFEQPTVVAQTLSSYIRPLEQTVALPQMDSALAGIDRIPIDARGPSFYPGLVPQYWFETFPPALLALALPRQFLPHTP